MLLSFCFGQATIVNYNFENQSVASYGALNPVLATNVTSTIAGSEVWATNLDNNNTATGVGVATAGSPFTANAAAGRSLYMPNSSGADTKFITFQLGGSYLPDYTSYKVYFQSKKINANSATTLTLWYCTDGVSYVSGGTMALVTGSWINQVFDLSGVSALNNQPAVYFKISASGAAGVTAINIDNFEVQAVCANATPFGVVPTNYTFNNPSVSLTTPDWACSANYTFKQTLPHKDAYISSGVTATVTFIAGTNATTMTSGTFNGIAIAMGSVVTTATTVTFTTPASSPDCAGTFTFVLNGITNPTSSPSPSNLTVSIPNVTGGTDSYTTYAPVYTQPYFNYSISSFPSYATLNAAGVCYNNLVAGQTYCWNFTWPASGTVKWGLIFNQGTSGCTSTNFSYEDDPVPACEKQNASTAGLFTTYKNCVSLYSGVAIGAGGTCLFTAGNVYTHCFTVPVNCTGSNVCPEIICSAGPCGGGLLPVTLLGFDALRNDNFVLLHWSTASEKNSNVFFIERSSDGISFAEMGKVKAAGNSNTTMPYEFMDELPVNGNRPQFFYYRLKQVDYDGKYEYFGPIGVMSAIPDTWSFVLQDNAASSELTGLLYSPEESDFTFHIIGLDGRIVQKENLHAVKGSNFIKIEVGPIAQGVYILKIADKKSTGQKKFSKL